MQKYRLKNATIPLKQSVKLIFFSVSYAVMRLLRHYIAIRREHNRLVINKYGIAADDNTCVYLHGALIFTNFMNHLVYARYRKSYDKRRTDFVIPLRLIHFDYPYAAIYDDAREVRIVINKDKKIWIKKYCPDPF